MHWESLKAKLAIARIVNTQSTKAVAAQRYNRGRQGLRVACVQLFWLTFPHILITVLSASPSSGESETLLLPAIRNEY